MISVNANIWAPHTAVPLSPARPSLLPVQHHPPDPRRTRATSWWGMPLLVAGLLGGWLVMGVGGVVFLGLLVGLWLWAGSMDKRRGSV